MSNNGWLHQATAHTPPCSTSTIGTTTNLRTCATSWCRSGAIMSVVAASSSSSSAWRVHGRLVGTSANLRSKTWRFSRSSHGVCVATRRCRWHLKLNYNMRELACFALLLCVHVKLRTKNCEISNSQILERRTFKISTQLNLQKLCPSNSSTLQALKLSELQRFKFPNFKKFGTRILYFQDFGSSDSRT